MLQSLPLRSADDWPGSLRALGRLVALALLLAFVWQPVLAQQAGAEIESRPGGPIKLSAFGEWSGPELFLRTELDEYTAIEIYPGNYTGPIEVLEFPVIFYQEVVVPAAEEGGEAITTHQPLGPPVTIPTDMEMPLLFVRWNPETERTECEVFEISPNQVPWGCVYLINFSDHTVGVELGQEGEPEPVPPSETNVIPYNVEEQTMTPIRLISEVVNQDGSRELVSAFSTRTVIDPEQRLLLIVFNSESHSSGVTFQLLLDFEPPSEEERAADAAADAAAGDAEAESDPQAQLE